MSTLRENLNVLIQLQQVDSLRDKMLRQRSSLDTGEEVAKTLAAAQSEYDKRKAELAQTHTSLKDAELELAGIERKIKDYEAKMRQGSVTNTREVMNFEKEFNQLNRQRAALDDKILTLMDETDVRSATLKTAERKVNDLERDHATLKEKFHTELTRLDAETSSLNNKRSEISKLVDDPVLHKKYDTLRARPGNAGVAIAHTLDNTCGACHMQIGTVAVTHAASGDTLAICENCGRIMV